MHPSLKPSLTHLVQIYKRTGHNAYGEPTETLLGPFRGRFEPSRARVTTETGDTVTLEGILFLDGPDLYIGQVEAGDTVVWVDADKRRAIRVIEPLFDLDLPDVVDHWEISM